ACLQSTPFATAPQPSSSLVSLLLLSLFFFYGYGHHRYLHSFPTRRSSHLFKLVPTGFIPMLDSGYLIVFAQLPDGDQIAGILHRSEEHTSELQSRSDLVCRLLLEKNKTN